MLGKSAIFKIVAIIVTDHQNITSKTNNLPTFRLDKITCISRNTGTPESG